MSATLRLAEELISRRSITPELMQGCIDIIMARLRPLGFACEVIDSGPPEFRVKNLWAKWHHPSVERSYLAIKTIAFAGHTDVVPAGRFGPSGIAIRSRPRTATASSLAVVPAT
jgi:succinyl-diaminopimelate desuccinylase